MDLVDLAMDLQNICAMGRDMGMTDQEIQALEWQLKIKVAGRAQGLTDKGLKELAKIKKDELQNSTRLLHPFIGQCATFVGEVAHRSSDGAIRTVLVKNIRLFGNRVVLADHIWSRYQDEGWALIEPFFGGTKVVIHGRVVKYTRSDHSQYVAIVPIRLKKL